RLNQLEPTFLMISVLRIGVRLRSSGTLERGKSLVNHIKAVWFHVDLRQTLSFYYVIKCDVGRLFSCAFLQHLLPAKHVFGELGFAHARKRHPSPALIHREQAATPLQQMVCTADFPQVDD